MSSRTVGDIEYQLLPGADRKTTDIVIERDGVIVVRPPKGYAPEQVDQVVDSKRLWIYRNLAEWKDINACAVVREWASGETFLYLGREHRLKFVNEQSIPLKLKNGSFCLTRSCIEEHGPEGAQEAFKQFYTKKGQERFATRVARYAPKTGVSPKNIKVKDIGYRWASCSAAGNLNFHWKCMMAPNRIIDYIVVHELCHLHHSNHSDAFWNEVDKVLPDYRESKRWLRLHGAKLDL